MQTKVFRVLFRLGRAAHRPATPGRAAWATLVLAVLLFTTCVVSQSGATNVTYHVTFNTDMLTAQSGFAGPLDSVTGSFTITFDPTQYYRNEQGGLTDARVSCPVVLPLSFGYDPVWQQMPEVLWLDGAADMLTGADDFLFVIRGFTTDAPWIEYFIRTQEGMTGQGVAPSGTISVTSVPVPGAFLLFGSGLLRLVGWRKLRKG